jgi:hypothetical protein
MHGILIPRKHLERKKGEEMNARKLRALTGCALAVAALAVSLGGCYTGSSSTAVSSAPASASATSTTQAVQSMQDWLAVDYVRRNLPKIEGTKKQPSNPKAKFAVNRFKVLYGFDAQGNQVVVMSLDDGQVAGVNEATEKQVFGVATRLSKQPQLFVGMKPAINSDHGLNELGFVIGAQSKTVHYVVLVPKKDDWLLTEMPHALIGAGPAFTRQDDTATVTLIGYEGDATSSAVEACQATNTVTPTDAATQKINIAVDRAGRREPPDLKELAKYYVYLGQEAFCNGVGPAIIDRDRGASWEGFDHQSSYKGVQTFDGLVNMYWNVDKDMYNSLR